MKYDLPALLLQYSTSPKTYSNAVNKSQSFCDGISWADCMTALLKNIIVLCEKVPGLLPFGQNE